MNNSLSYVSCKLIMYMCFVDIKFFFFLFDQLLNERVSGPGEVSLSSPCSDELKNSLIGRLRHPLTTYVAVSRTGHLSDPYYFECSNFLFTK